MNAREYLKRIKKIDTTIQNKLAELRLEQNLGIASKIVEQTIVELIAEKQKIIKNIEKLPEPEYDVLHKAYVQYETFQEIASDRKISYSLVTTIHGRALKMLEEIIK